MIGICVRGELGMGVEVHTRDPSTGESDAGGLPGYIARHYLEMKRKQKQTTKEVMDEQCPGF